MYYSNPLVLMDLSTYCKTVIFLKKMLLTTPKSHKVNFWIRSINAPMSGSTLMHFYLLNIQTPEAEVYCLNPFHSTFPGNLNPLRQIQNVYMN